MKIYIVNIIPQSLKNKIKNMMESFEYNEKITYELHSQDFGLHILEDDKIYLKESTYNHDYELIKGYSLPDGGNSMDLLIDKHETNNIPVISQLPVNYIHLVQDGVVVVIGKMILTHLHHLVVFHELLNFYQKYH